MSGDDIDRALLRDARHDPERFGELYDRHVHAVMAYCARRTGSRQVALDLTAEVFAAAYATRGRFRDSESPIRAWLFGIARRQVALYHRREHVSRKYRGRFAIPVDAPVAEDALARIDDLVDLAPMRVRLAEGMASLTPAERAAVELRFFDDLPYAEIARRLDCSDGAARVRVSRALTRLADGWEDS